MDAKEFFEKNRGKYFDYQGHKVRVVGMSSTSIPILVTAKYIVPATEFDFTDFDSNKSKSII